MPLALAPHPLVRYVHKPWALAIAQGGAQGAYGLGAILALRKTLKDDLGQLRAIFGTSVGALIGTKIALGHITGHSSHLSDIEHLFRTLVLDDLRGDGLFRLVSAYVTEKDWKHLKRASHDKLLPLSVEVSTFCVSTVKPCSFSSFTVPDRDTWVKVLVASATVPEISEPVVLGPNSFYYIDGAFGYYHPYVAVSESILLAQGEFEGIIGIGYRPKLSSRGTIVPWSSVSCLPAGVGQRIAAELTEVMSERVTGVRLPFEDLCNLAGTLCKLLPNEYRKQGRKMFGGTFATLFETDPLKTGGWLLELRPEKKIHLTALEMRQPEMSQLISRGYTETEQLLSYVR